MNKEKRMWNDLNSRGIYTVEEAEKNFRAVKSVDFGFLAAKIDLDEIENIRQALFR